MRIVSRAEWGARPATGTTNLQPARVTMLVLHHTTGTFAGPQTVRNIQAFHMGPSRKWADVGYNFLVAPTGEIFEGRGWGKQGAHARGHNSESIGVAYIGDGRTEMPDPAKRAVVWLAGEADRRFGTLRRVGHRDVGSTVCPGDAIHGWWMGGAALPAATLSGGASGPEVPSGGSVPEKPEVSSERISERPDADGWGNRPSWVSKGAWQRLIDWRNSQ